MDEKNKASAEQNEHADDDYDDTHKEEELQGSAALEEVLKYNKPNTFGKGMLQLYAICALIYLCSTMNGFDGSLMSSINALEEYLDYYNMKQASAGTGLVFSIFNIGQMVGSLFIWIADWKGRKFGIAIGCLGVIVGTVVTATAKTMSTFIGGRFLLSFFATISCSTAPMYCVEISPPHMRGTVSGMYNTLYYMGSILAAFSVLGTMIHLEGPIVFRLPIWVQLLCPGIVLCGVYFIPESPRWLVGNDRIEEAQELIAKYHANGDMSHPFVNLEISEMVKSLQDVGLTTPKSMFNIASLVATKSDRYRLFLIVAFSWFSQFSGNNVSSYYLPIMLDKVGFDDPKMQILMNGIYGITGWIAAAAGSYLHDWVGRRKMFLSSTIGMSVCLAIVAATTAEYQKNSSKALSSASISFIFIFGVVFAIGFTSMQPVYIGEVSSNKLRAKSMMLMQLVGGCASFVNQFAAPVAMENIKYWFYVFFVFWDLVEAGIIYLFFIETKGRTLEELEVIFQANNPRNASLRPWQEMQDVETAPQV